MPELSVVIPVYNEAGLIARVLEVVRASLARQKRGAKPGHPATGLERARCLRSSAAQK